MKIPKIVRSKINVVALVALLFMMGGTIAGAVLAFGKQGARVDVIEQRQDYIEHDVKSLRNKIDGLAVGQAATHSTVESISKQQEIDRTHIDSRLNDIIRAIQRTR